ncbi:hypothetical protein CHH57_02060 [Niallia circulans]|uniref:Uncharacterized protein n=1 Tax=Niallia circulans TaxID=1397 RepID=A0AA91Z2D9_NIACI|nr:hypothetical protein [Niallia circulans]PAD84982.1 hypothetical protein CHH57_02060 [Niallia circulans]
MGLINIEDYKAQKLTEKINVSTNSTREGGLIIANACYRLAHLAKKYDSELKVNKRNLDKLNK